MKKIKVKIIKLFAFEMKLGGNVNDSNRNRNDNTEQSSINVYNNCTHSALRIQFFDNTMFFYSFDKKQAKSIK